jgi:hypothetical protein
VIVSFLRLTLLQSVIYIIDSTNPICKCHLFKSNQKEEVTPKHAFLQSLASLQEPKGVMMHAPKMKWVKTLKAITRE